MADDTEKAIIYAFDQSGAVAADLRERALSYLRDLQVRAEAPTSLEPPTRVLALLGHFFVVFAACDRSDPRRAPPSTGAAPFGDPFRPPLPRRAHPRPSSD